MDKGSLLYRMPTSSGLRDLTLTFCTIDDLEIQRYGLSKLRRYRLLRLLAESRGQGSPLSYRDLSLLLLASATTLRRDIQEMRKMGLKVEIGRRSHGEKQGVK